MVRCERLSLAPSVMPALWSQSGALDFRPLAPAIQASTLVIEHEDGTWPGHPGRLVAEAIPGARHVVVPGRNLALWAPQPRELLESIETFLTGESSSGDGGASDRVLATVLFTDIVDSTHRAGRLGDRAWRDLLDRHDAVAASIVARHRGRLIKHTGDGLLASYDGPTRAVRCGDDLRHAIAEMGLTVRMAIHTGEVEVRGDDLSGIGVHVAARVLGLCEPEAMLVTRTVKDLVIGSGITFEDRGTHPLKGIDDPWQLFEVIAT